MTRGHTNVHVHVSLFNFQKESHSSNLFLIYSFSMDGPHYELKTPIFSQSPNFHFAREEKKVHEISSTISEGFLRSNNFCAWKRNLQPGTIQFQLRPMEGTIFILDKVTSTRPSTCYVSLAGGTLLAFIILIFVPYLMYLKLYKFKVCLIRLLYHCQMIMSRSFYVYFYL